MFLQFTFIIALGAFCLLAPVQGKESTALGAGLREGPEIGNKLAVWVVATAVKEALLFAHSLY